MILHIRSRAFTLIELLVVVAIMAVLMALLLPALSNARQQAKTVLCASNMKQIAFGMLLYSTENNNVAVNWLDDYHHISGDSSSPYPWLIRIMPMVKNRGELWVCPASYERASLNMARMHAAIDKKAVDDLSGDFYQQAYKSINIGINRWAFNRTKPAYGLPAPIRRMTEVPYPSGVIYAADGAGYNSRFYQPNNTQGFITVYQVIWPQDKDGVYIRHGRGANMVFADGHAENVDIETIKVWGVANSVVWYRHWLGVAR